MKRGRDESDHDAVYYDPASKTDVVFVDVNKRQYHVHAVMLANRCGEVFNLSDCAPSEKLFIVLEYTEDVIFAFLKYVYKPDTLKIVPKEDCFQLLEMSAKFNGPVDFCIENILRYSSQLKASDLYEWSVRLKSSDLHKIWLRNLRQSLDKWEPDLHLGQWKVGDFCEVVTRQSPFHTPFPVHKFYRFTAQIIKIKESKFKIFNLVDNLSMTVGAEDLFPRGTMVFTYSGNNPTCFYLHTQSCTDARQHFQKCTCDFLISSLE
jgi:hypothetical protein